MAAWQVQWKLAVALCLCLVFMVVEVVGGVMAHRLDYLPTPMTLGPRLEYKGLLYTLILKIFGRFWQSSRVLSVAKAVCLGPKRSCILRGQC